MQPGRAHRNDFQVHVFDRIEEPEQDLEQELEDETERIIAQYASLKDHPGWELVRKDFDATIMGYRSGQFIQKAISSGKSEQEIGRLTITGNAIADELEKIILTVETAAEQIAEKRAKNGRSK